MTDSRKINGEHPEKPKGPINLSPDLAARLIQTIDRIESDVKMIVRDHSDFKLAVKVELESHKWKHGIYGLLGGILSGLGSVVGLKITGLG